MNQRMTDLMPALKRLRLADLETLTDEELREAEQYLYNWHELTEREQSDRRKKREGIQ